MPLTGWLNRFFRLIRQGLIKTCCIKRFLADVAINQIELSNLVPLIFQEMFEQDGLLGTDPPAGSAPGAQGHVVKQGPFSRFVLEHEGIGRAVLYAGQAAVALFGDFKVGHRWFSYQPVGQRISGPISRFVPPSGLVPRWRCSQLMYI